MTKDLRADLRRYFDSAFPAIQQARWPFTVDDLTNGIMATIESYFPTPEIAALPALDVEKELYRQALSEVYDAAPGPWLALKLSKRTQETLQHVRDVELATTTEETTDE